MTRSSLRVRDGFSVLDLAVVVFVLGTGLGLLVVALQETRAEDQRANCTNNLRQLGLALHSYHDTTSSLPSENVDNPHYIKKLPATHGHTSFYCFLLPYVEEAKQLMPTMGRAGQTAGDLTKAQPVKIFLCPDRHILTNATKVALRDYGYRQSSGQKHSILDSPKFVTFTVIANQNGTGNTALLSHYWWDAKKYNDASRTNKTDGWANEGYDGKNRAIDQFDTDFNQLDSKALPGKAQTAMGSPHAAGNPTLMADGAVRVLPYDPKFPAVNLIFDYTNKTAIKLP